MDAGNLSVLMRPVSLPLLVSPSHTPPSPFSSSSFLVLFTCSYSIHNLRKGQAVFRFFCGEGEPPAIPAECRIWVTASPTAGQDVPSPSPTLSPTRGPTTGASFSPSNSAPTTVHPTPMPTEFPTPSPSSSPTDGSNPFTSRDCVHQLHFFRLLFPTQIYFFRRSICASDAFTNHEGSIRGHDGLLASFDHRR